MIIVFVLFMAVATLVSTLPYWLGRSTVRYQIWARRDQIFDELRAQGYDHPVLWGLVDRCEIMVNLSRIMTPMTLAIIDDRHLQARRYSPPFPSPEDLATLQADERAYYNQQRELIDGLLVRQLVFSSWNGLVVGAIVYLRVFFRPGPAKAAIRSEMRNRVHREPENVMATGASLGIC